MSDNFNIANKLKELRLKNNLQIKQMAEKLDLPPTTYAGYEKDREPKASTLIKISQVFDISLDELCGVPKKNSINNISDKIDLVTTLMFNSDCEFKFFDIRECTLYGDPLYRQFFTFNDNLLGSFLNEFSKMYKLYKDKTINKDLIELWIQNQKTIYLNYEKENVEIVSPEEFFEGMPFEKKD